MLESLESRRMFSVTADAFHETLYIWGDNQNNGISVEKQGNDLVAKRYNGSSYVEFFHASDSYVKNIRIYGYAGNDTISIADNVTDPAVIYGGKGADWLKGGGGQTELWGHGNWAGDPDHGPASDDSAADVTVSGKGYAIHYGQKGNDTLITDDNATSGYDVMYGGDGNDKFYINGHGNRAYAYGQNGNDYFAAKQSATQKASFYGGAGYDQADYTAWTSAVYVRPDGATESGLRFGTRRQILDTDVEFVQGTNQADHFSGSEGNNTFYGHGGNDLMYGHGGNDILVGGDGNDEIFGGNGDDYLVGDAGNDRIYGNAGNDSIFGNAGNDKLFGDGGNDVISGGDGSDEIRGGAGNDTLRGDRDGDWIYGDAGSDKLVGGHGADYLVSNDGIAGNDLVYGDNEDGTEAWGFLDVAWTDKSWLLKDFTFGVESVSH
jgi:Ca2+-binding RTX toxin-like protein